jgi:adenylate cyclase
MAYWNAPIKIKHHADAAVTSALTQIALLKEINQTIHAQYNVTIAIGIGIHTGVVTAGDMGSEGRSDYTVIGDNVNIASRLESLTKRYDAQILITESTYHQLEKKYPIRSIDIVHVKGRHGAIKIFEVLTEDKKELATYEEAIVLYREAKLDEALILFNALTQMYTDPLYILYKQRCEHFLNNPSLKFTPVFTMSGK